MKIYSRTNVEIHKIGQVLKFADQAWKLIYRFVT